LVLALGYYLITNLQWYNYKLERVIFKHKKSLWHLIYFLIPLFAYYLTGRYFWIYFYIAYLPLLYKWSISQDKKLVFTDRVKRFFAFLLFSTILGDILCKLSPKCEILGVILPLTVALGASYLFERINFKGFEKRAKKKLESMEDLTIVAITASYGKTSIKNFIYHLLKDNFTTYKTPRSVNTIGGIIKDINEDLPRDTQIYIAEAGARERGDIDKIARLLNHHYGVVGVIGPAHIEYFKTLERIRDTKMELLNSDRLKKAFVHKSANIKPTSNVVEFGENIEDIKATLEGVEFSLDIDGKKERFFAPVLGSFNAVNLTAAILVARELGVSTQKIKDSLKTLPSVEHRLQKIEAGGKLIIDDSFNGNLEGMSASYELVKSFKGRKIVVTPGIVESDEESNIKLAKKIDEIFDTVIITGSLNAKILNENIKIAKKIILRDKSELEEVLANESVPGDLVLFSNDAPSFI
jgi:UDP-N-acetylmuramoyl-tripeptide--D-alanyl-D-alanine ligase